MFYCGLLKIRISIYLFSLQRHPRHRFPSPGDPGHKFLRVLSQRRHRRPDGVPQDGDAGAGEGHHAGLPLPVQGQQLHSAAERVAGL